MGKGKSFQTRQMGGVIFLAAMVLAGCDQPAPITLPRETPKPEKESFTGFTSGTPLPLSNAADPSVPSRAEQPTPAPLAPDAQAAIEDYSKAMRELRSDPAVQPTGDLDITQNPGALQRLNNAIIGHMQVIEDAQDRARAAMNPQQRKAWAAQKKEIDEGE